MHFHQPTYLLTLTYLLTNPSYLSTYLNTYLLFCINTYLRTLTYLFTNPSYLSTYLNIYLLFCINTYLRTLTYLLTNLSYLSTYLNTYLYKYLPIPPFLTSCLPTDIKPNLPTGRTTNPTIFPLLDIPTIELSIKLLKIHAIRL